MMGSEVTCRVPSHWFSDFSQCLYDWQTLFAGGLAILTVAAIICQIRQMERHRREEIKRRHTAARIAMPFTLATLSSYFIEISGRIADAIREIDNGNWAVIMSGQNPGSMPLENVEFPQEAVAGISDFSETLSDPKDIKHLAELSARLQILQSRYASFEKKRTDAKPWLYTILIDCGTASYLCNSIYNYARFAQDEGFSVVEDTNAKSWEGVKTAIGGLLFERPNDPVPYVNEACEQIDQYKEAGSSPWITKFEA